MSYLMNNINQFSLLFNVELPWPDMVSERRSQMGFLVTPLLKRLLAIMPFVCIKVSFSAHIALPLLKTVPSVLSAYGDCALRS